MIKIAFFDIDGTLLKMGHTELSERTKQTLLSLQNNGVLLSYKKFNAFAIMKN